MRTAAFQELTSSPKGQTFNKQLQSSALSAVMGKEGLWVPRTGGGVLRGRFHEELSQLRPNE